MGNTTHTEREARSTDAETRGKIVFCGTDGHFCSVGCHVQGEHRDWALTDPWVSIHA